MAGALSVDTGQQAYWNRGQVILPSISKIDTGTQAYWDRGQPEPVQQSFPTLVAAGYATETEQGLAAGANHALAINIASETEVALAASWLKSGHPVGYATETDTALHVGVKHLRAVGYATETETPLAVSWRKIAHLGIAAENEVPLAAGFIRPGSGPYDFNVRDQPKLA